MLRYFLAACLLIVWLPINAFASDTHFADKPEVKQFIAKMVKQYKFDKTALTALFNTVTPRPVIIRAHQAPREKQQAWFLYERSFVNEWRIQHGLMFWNKHAKVLAEAEKKYGVPASIIIATLGVETRYGQKMGGYHVMDALSNIAFSNSSRSAFFKRELQEFLLLAREQHINPAKQMGSYAGAMGQPQFMPSSYRAYAVSYSGKAPPDLVHNTNDAIFSVANYYGRHGWKAQQPIAVPATLVSDKHLPELRSKTIPSTQLTHYGLSSQYKFFRQDLQVSLIELNNYFEKEYWVGFYNFKVIKRYNSSNLYAMAVFSLSRHIVTLRSKLNNG